MKKFEIGHLIPVKATQRISVRVQAESEEEAKRIVLEAARTGNMIHEKIEHIEYYEDIELYDDDFVLVSHLEDRDEDECSMMYAFDLSQLSGDTK